MSPVFKYCVLDCNVRCIRGEGSGVGWTDDPFLYFGEMYLYFSIISKLTEEKYDIFSSMDEFKLTVMVGVDNATTIQAGN